MFNISKRNEVILFIALLIIAIFIAISVTKCERIKGIETRQVEKEFKAKEKILLDSLKKVSKQIEYKEVVKEKIVVKYVTKKQTIIEYKDSLIYGKDTATLITIYDNAIDLCDSLNMANNSIIYSQKSKINILDSIYSNESKRANLYAENIKQLNKNLKKQHRQSQCKIIGFSTLSFLGGIGTGFLISKIK